MRACNHKGYGSALEFQINRNAMARIRLLERGEERSLAKTGGAGAW
jgi:hypothetical protein